MWLEKSSDNELCKLFISLMIWLSDDFHSLFGPEGNRLNANTQLLALSQLALHVFPDGNQRNQFLCELIRAWTYSVCSPSKSTSAAALFLSAKHLQPASVIAQDLIMFAVLYAADLDLASLSGLKTACLMCDFLDRISSPKSWEFVKDNEKVVNVMNTLCTKFLKTGETNDILDSLQAVILSGLKGVKTTLPPKSLNQAFRFMFRVMSAHEWSPELRLWFVKNCMTCPGMIALMDEQTLAESKFDLIIDDIMDKTLAKKLQYRGSIDAINMLGNFVQLTMCFDYDVETNIQAWVRTVEVIIAGCKSSDNNRKMQAAIARVQPQIEMLWSAKVVDTLFRVVSASLPPRRRSIKDSDPMIMQKIGKLIKAKRSSANVSIYEPFIQVMVSELCRLYRNIIITFPNKKTDILSGLCRNEQLLCDLWIFIILVGVDDCWKLLRTDPHVRTINLTPLELFAECAHSLISILDEKEMYETQTPFTLEQLCEVASYCNTFCFRCIWNDWAYPDNKNLHRIFISMYNLVALLIMRDSRRQFAPGINFWIIKEVKPNVIVDEFERNSRRTQLLIRMMPHVVPLKERIGLFRRLVQQEKTALRHERHIITVHRGRLLDDGFRQLCKFTPRALKGMVRVKFVNEQGLDEAGIDQDGVFKEFLELTLKQVFSPDLNLFQATAHNVLYPSHTSAFQDDHLALFTFVGQMLGKAVYEGICTDFYLAPVLLASVLKKKLWAFDELASLDPELYKNLTFVKHYEGDVADLELTFAYTEDVMGEVKTRELTPGGSHIKVTNDNKIAYIHRMALFRVVHQTHEQCEKFVEGFRTILSPVQLSLFTPHELQFLISGQNDDIDMNDLKRHAHYYGGFHSNHRVIKWLWEVLERDFTAEERHLFLKFCTSCSRPPILGFAYLEPKFSIRCVETSDENDHGDTLGSVVRGFLSIKRKTPTSRLPTASTCFNLLKLPNYSKKSTLLEKLRYAIHAGSGFELS